jgi:hypothetical protein
MTTRQRNYLRENWLTTEELHEYTGIPISTIKQRSQYKKYDYVLKGNNALYWKGDFSPRETPQTDNVRNVDNSAGHLSRRRQRLG